MPVVHDLLENYDLYKEKFYKFREVKATKTKYTIRLDFGKRKVILSKDGEPTTNILPLINKVKADAKRYLEGVKHEKILKNEIFWYYYNEDSEILKKIKNQDGYYEGIKIAKIDLSAAYWTKACNLGIISKKTSEYFDKLVFESIEEKKKARLKAFGSLATVKSVVIYRYGKRCQKFIPTIKNEEFINLYLYVCDMVSKEMQKVLYHIDAIYFYWDCIFVDPSKINEVIEIFEALGYNCTVENEVANILIAPIHSEFECTKNLENPNKKTKFVTYPIKI